VALSALAVAPSPAGAEGRLPRWCDGVVGGWDGRSARGSLCVGLGGHGLAGLGGNVPAVCGTVLLADLNVLDGPTEGPGPDPSRCPYPGGPADVHDPALVRAGRTYVLFSTGPGLPTWRSSDLRSWTSTGPALPHGLPGWAHRLVPGAVDPWAPDVSWFGGTWHLYYAVSTFGAKVSAIGQATSPTLDPRDPRYGWTDRGPVVASNDLSDANAIDPNVVLDHGRPWLVWGSFWGGIRAAPLDPATGQLAPPAVPVPVAARALPSWGIEGSFVVPRDGWFYLFTSFDHCCRAGDSTYNVRVGRARQVTGPYVDAAGVPLLAGGGTLVLAGAGDRRGPGHVAVLHDGPTWRLAFHWYDAADGGRAKLGLLPIRWTPGGWPTVRWADLATPDLHG
jgi:arabinan endo-1,5-alpha-L-arabinosidase